MHKQKRVFGIVEAIFDIVYLLTATLIGFYLLFNSSITPASLAGCMALLLAFGDAFHLIPRIAAIFSAKEDRYARAMGIGKLVASITMTGFYVFLWHIGLFLCTADTWAQFTPFVYTLATIRIILCVLPQNRWLDRHPPLRFAIYRNIPFILLGALVALLFALAVSTPFHMIWIAIAFSFLFYLPVVFFVNAYPKLGMLMLPKTLAYISMLIFCLSL